MKAKHGFTLVEILIVVVILGVLAAIVIPQFAGATIDAKTSGLVSNLQAIRFQLELYKIHHNGNLPASSSEQAFIDCMTKYTNVDGSLAASQTPGQRNVYGPYIQRIPVNPFTNSSTITFSGADSAGTDTGGWHFNTVTGKFQADDNGTCPNGTAHTTL